MEPNTLGQWIETIFISFEKESGWRLSLPAKVIIQQGFFSIAEDSLGMGEYASSSDPGGLFVSALAALPGFLQHLRKAATNRPENEQAAKIIGGIFVLQHSAQWRHMMKCPCWPA